jgi:tetratricopeptide (TPR) repeat protein
MVGYAQARMGMRAEGLKSINQAISYYQSALKTSPNPLLQRYLAIAETKRGDIRWMDGDYPAALADYRQAEAILKPLADSDPENDLIQGDRTRIDYLQARLLIGSHQYKEALPLLKKAAAANQKYLSKGEPDHDTVRGSGDILISLGETYAGNGNFTEALQAFQKATTVLSPTGKEPLEDDINCELATAFVKTGDTLLAMERPAAAKAAYRKALDIALPRVTANNQNVPELYPIANAYFGSGDASVALARRGAKPDEREKSAAEACALFGESKAAWAHIPNPSPITPNGFLSRLPPQLDSRIARCPSSVSQRSN